MFEGITFVNGIYTIGGLMLAFVLIFVLKDEDATIPRKTSIPCAIIFAIFTLLSIHDIILHGIHIAYITNIVTYSLSSILWFAVSKWSY